MKKWLLILFVILIYNSVSAEDGYRLWLRYNTIDNPALLQQYRQQITSINCPVDDGKLVAANQELQTGLSGLLGKKVPAQPAIINGAVLLGLPERSPVIRKLVADSALAHLGDEGFIIRTVMYEGKNITLITANKEAGILYGVFHFLRLMQTQQPIRQLSITSAPKIKIRLLNHWDNLNRTVERGYAGSSIWDWQRLPGYIDQRYIDYARANASIGINGTVLTNVNANAIILTDEWLQKIAALANAFRPYNIKVYLTARFSAPVEIGKLKTADPLNEEVRKWWKDKTDEIYKYIPDFGGFLVKANSEGQPGPQNYNRTHADGANMLADAVAPHGGIIMWRAFVYSNETPEDRFKQAYNDFKPLDGQFRKNVLVQVKNGPIDFQPREPFHPLFGAMPQTPLMMEYQLTQEYLGFATHLVYMAPLFKEVLDADTHAKNNSTVAQIVDGTTDGHTLSGMAGVSNIGSDINWTGHPFGQANWYTLGRLAWDNTLTSAQIANEWLRQTFTNKSAFVDTVQKLMLASREIMVNYMTPLGLHHIMGYGHHYGPAPWYNKAPRADWNPVYFHKADSIGIGFNRTATGSNALAQYQPAVRQQFEELATCPEAFLLWFHHVPWDYKMHSGKTLWETLCDKYYSGVDSVRWIQRSWNGMKNYIDAERFSEVKQLLAIQEQEAVWWRNACLLYFQTFSNKPIPARYEKPDHTLAYYEGLEFPYAPH
ncbi:alpha-glucuronidase [Niastella koreensis]|uniref:Xylan alpha-1,2-glucuronidase n=2 Tax=Niastella koreensis TaxID=354356 RepID=G8TBM3_NIAKG|nr:alpha-glucuronidase family glycosyl hydrolase [Niastella koreensis]AEV97133.1 Alpha-glucuronidase [Niastella koreensis GR20-10]OQP39181.1 alpha-glucuronidase [Niastella koreensis]